MLHVTNFTESSASFTSLEELMRQALLLYKWRKEHVPELSDNDAVLMFVRGFLSKRFPTEEERQGIDALEVMLTARTAWLLRWVELAFPRVRMGHQLAALLMATTISPSEISHVMPPWPSFVIEVPTTVLPIRVKPDTDVFAEVLRIHVNADFLPGRFTDGPHWSLELSGPGIEVHRIGSLTELATPRQKRDSATSFVTMNEVRIDPLDQPLPLERELFGEEYDWNHEERVASLAARLVVGVCVLMTERAEFSDRRVRMSTPLGSFARRLGADPESRLYTLTRPVRIDVRPSLDVFLRGDSRTPTVQSLVAGHHKRQPCGPGGLDRKWIYVEPYWRGPEDGPIAVRPHTHP